MKLKDCRANEDDYSRTASTIARNLGYAGIAIIWIYKTEVNVVPQGLRCATVSFIAFFFLDLLQYLIGTEFWGWFTKKKLKEQEIKDDNGEPRLDQDRDFSNPYEWFYWITTPIYWLKLIALFIAYILVFCFIVQLG